MATLECATRYFDGHSSRPQPATLTLQGTDLELRFGGVDAGRRYARGEVDVAEPWPGCPTPLALPDGGTAWVGVEGQALVRELRSGRRLAAVRLIASWLAVLCCLALLLALLVWFEREGAGWLAERALPLVPHSVDAGIGAKAWEQFDARWLVASQHGSRCDRLRRRLQSLAPAYADAGPVDLQCRRFKDEAGFNAFTLPGGRIVMLDGMLERLDDDEVVAVLGHELGHVAHRDTMRELLHSFGMVAAAGVVLGDFSTLASTLATGLDGLSYSRDVERSADAYGLAFLDRVGLDRSVLRSVWRKLGVVEGGSGGGAVPGWISTHPSTDERLRAAQSAR